MSNRRISYALRRGRKNPLSSGLRPNSLLGVKWRFLNEKKSLGGVKIIEPSKSRADIEIDWNQREEIANEFENRFPSQERSFVSILEEHDTNLAQGVHTDEQYIDAEEVSDVSDEDDEFEELDNFEEEHASKLLDVDSDGGEEERSRSPSPVIIWRPSARVQIATNLPPELKSVFVDEKKADTDGSEKTSTAAGNLPSLVDKKKPIQKHRVGRSRAIEPVKQVKKKRPKMQVRW